jgi:hypothetical protein
MEQWKEANGFGVWVSGRITVVRSYSVALGDADFKRTSIRKLIE